MKSIVTLLLAAQVALLNPASLLAVDPTPGAFTLPGGVQPGSAKPGRLAAAVAAAIKVDPKSALAIVTSVMQQLGPDDKARASAVMAVVATLVPPAELLTLVAAAAKANPALAPDIAAGAARSAPALAIAITKAAAYGAPLQSGAIAAAVALAVPGVPQAALLAAATAAAEQVAKGLPLFGAGNGGAGGLLPNMTGISPNPANVTGNEVSASQ